MGKVRRKKRANYILSNHGVRREMRQIGAFKKIRVDRRQGFVGMS